MSVLTAIQVKRVANFLKASCERIPNNSDRPKLGQWLDILSTELGYRNWNVSNASLDKAPALTGELAQWPDAHSTFFGVARVLLAGEKATYHLSYSVNRELSRHRVATELANKIRSRTAHRGLNHRLHYSRPDIKLGDGQIAPPAKNRHEGCPIVIGSDSQKITIHLWWLSELYQDPESMPAWAKDSPSHLVHFDGKGDVQLREYGDDEPDESLTDTFLKALTGKVSSRRTCLYFPRWYQAQEIPSPMLVEEGNPHAQPVSVGLTGDWSERRSAIAALNAEQGLSSLDCEEIAARYETAEQIRNEEDYAAEFTGIFED